MAAWRKLTAGLAAAMAACALCSASAADDLTEKADALLQALHDKGRFSGAVVVSARGRTVYARGFGLADVERAVAFTPDTPSDGGSLAKPVTAAAALLLVSEGRLELDAPVSRQVPEYPHPTTTLRQLLSHSGGLPDYGAFQTLLDAGQPVETADLLHEVSRRRLPPASQPREAFDYCNLCYDVAALAVARAAGEPYADFVRRRVLGPTGAKAAFVRPARFAAWPGVRTRGYRWVDGRADLNDAFDNEGFHGGGNIYFSARDLAAWGAAWADGAGLPPVARRLALSATRVGRGVTGLTLGNWYCVRDRSRCYYRGHHQGFDGLVYWDAQRRLAVALLSNSTLDPTLQHALPRRLVALAEGRAAEPQPGAGSAPPFDAAAAAGAYKTPDGRRLTITNDGPQPRILLDDGPSYRLFRASPSVLYAPGLDAYLSYEAGVLRWATVFETFEARR